MHRMKSHESLTINIGHLANCSKQKSMILKKHNSILKMEWIEMPNAPYSERYQQAGTIKGHSLQS